VCCRGITSGSRGPPRRGGVYRGHMVAPRAGVLPPTWRGRILFYPERGRDRRTCCARYSGKASCRRSMLNTRAVPAALRRKKRFHSCGGRRAGFFAAGPSAFSGPRMRA